MQKKMDFATKHILIFILQIGSSLGRGCNEDKCNATVEVPLVDKLEAPLKAELDLSNVNEKLKELITSEVKHVVEKAISDLVQTTVDERLKLAEEKLKVENNEKLSAMLNGKIAFTVTLIKDFMPPINQVIKFDDVKTNKGGAYSTSTGIFTAPTAGMYSFSMTIRSANAGHLHCELWVNNAMIVKAHAHELSTGSANIAVQLKKGDRAFVKKDFRNGEYMIGRDWSMFSGFLVM